jgi:IMP dehydrogenase
MVTGIKLTDFIKRGVGLTFDDVLLVPNHSSVLPSDVILKTKLTKKIELNVPIISSAMDTVTESATAVAMARAGGIGIIHKNLTIDAQVEEVKKVKHSEFWVINNPITVKPDSTVGELNALREEHNISSFPVVNNGKLVGLVTSRDLRFEERESRKVKEIMTRKLITGNPKISLAEAKKLLHKNKIEKLPLVNTKGQLKGLITMRDIQSKTQYPYASKDSKGRLIVGAAVGPRDFERVKALIKAEVDVVVIDTAHGHSQNVLNAVRKIKKEFDIQVIAGNVATREGAEALIRAGADAVKCGVGPGTICTTRIISGVGVPQITAIYDCSVACRKAKVPLIADGGITYSGEITKALAAGADVVMLGGLFAGTEESPGRTIFLNNRKFKQYRGMGSLGAMSRGSKDRYGQAGVRNQQKLVPEGIEGIVPFKGTINEVVYQLIGGLRSGMGYCGARTIVDLHRKTKMLRVTHAALKESHPHNITITEEAPNYSNL